MLRRLPWLRLRRIWIRLRQVRFFRSLGLSLNGKRTRSWGVLISGLNGILRRRRWIGFARSCGWLSLLWWPRLRCRSWCRRRWNCDGSWWAVHRGDGSLLSLACSGGAGEARGVPDGVGILLRACRFCGWRWKHGVEGVGFRFERDWAFRDEPWGHLLWCHWCGATQRRAVARHGARRG